MLSHLGLKLVSSRPLVWPPIASAADARPAVPCLQHTHMYNTNSGREVVLFAEVVYHTQETELKTRDATHCAPLSSPSCVSSKDHLLAAHESLWEENRELLCRDTPPPPAISASWQVYSGLGCDEVDACCLCFYGGVTSFFMSVFYFEGSCRRVVAHLLSLSLSLTQLILCFFFCRHFEC